MAHYEVRWANGLGAFKRRFANVGDGEALLCAFHARVFRSQGAILRHVGEPEEFACLGVVTPLPTPAPLCECGRPTEKEDTPCPLCLHLDGVTIVQAKVLRALAEGPGTTAELVVRIGAIAWGTVHRTLQVLKKEGRVRVLRQTEIGTTNANVYGRGRGPGQG